MTIDSHVWHELLAPSSPLVKQLPHLRSALIAGDFMGSNVYVHHATLDDRLSEAARKVVQGLAVYFEHMWFMAQPDHRGADECLRVACQESGAEVRDLMRLANLMTGIAVGSLTRQNLTEVQKLICSVLEPEHAQSIMRKIVERRPMMQRWISRAVRGVRQVFSSDSRRESGEAEAALDAVAID